MKAWIREVTGASSVGELDALETLWGGYGQILRAPVEGLDAPSVIVKHVTPGPGRGRSHERKLRSYDVERAFYTEHTPRLERARVARCFAAERTSDGWRFLLEDLNAAGFDGRRGALRGDETDLCLEWLARFHATFLGMKPEGLWKVGSYWHLATRPDELAAIRDKALRSAASRLDAALRGAKFRTLVHGDAKPANFCFGRAEVAAVDFQYVGGGCGMRDVAYLLFGRRGWGAGDDGAAPLLDAYFAHLRDALAPDVDADALEAEWRGLYPIARADFHRFLAGWSPSARSLRGYRDALEALD